MTRALCESRQLARRVIQSNLYKDVPFLFVCFGGVFWPRCVACRILVPPPGMEPVPPAVEAQSPNHWTAREVPKDVALTPFKGF